MNEGNKKPASVANEREAEATSKETLKDIEDNEKSSAAKQNGGQESDVPSPDGGFDESDESKDADPM
ncbi:MAG: hypothetical protein ABR557_13185 [Pyrinomonadaceae bacterium]